MYSCFDRYDPETNKTELSYYLIFDGPANAVEAARSASITANITGHILPIMIDNQLVRFSENSTFLVRTRPDNTIDLSKLFCLYTVKTR